ncbi:hypothetical protein [Clostridium perfringens]|uniref:hypothetical protein n=1 Tax=Clostridium perfringens TaxID=1502 RepID=UPI0018E4B002|nr:hypothetical protein [Clostridium perfringens]MBI5997483.1 hypothetical protein [Clostridium perfringens]
MINLLGNNLDGDTWEKICDYCYRQRYQQYHFVKIPSNYNGDGGIEGYTGNGVVYQCYYPEREYSDNELYEKLRDKLTRDIKKLIKNEKELKAVGVKYIKEWHFVIPEYRDKRILIHAEEKRKEILTEKNRKKLDYISNDFKICIKVIDDFSVEICRYVNLTDGIRFSFPLMEKKEINKDEYPSEQLENIERKLKAISGQTSDQKRLDNLINIYAGFYLNWIELRTSISDKNPELFEKILNIQEAYKTDIEMRCKTNFDSTINAKLFNEIMDDFGKALNKEFNNLVDPKSISDLKHDTIATWLAECPLEFY